MTNRRELVFSSGQREKEPPKIPPAQCHNARHLAHCARMAETTRTLCCAGHVRTRALGAGRLARCSGLRLRHLLPCGPAPASARRVASYGAVLRTLVGLRSQFQGLQQLSVTRLAHDMPVQYAAWDQYKIKLLLGHGFTVGTW